MIDALTRPSRARTFVVATTLLLVWGLKGSSPELWVAVLWVVLAVSSLLMLVPEFGYVFNVVSVVSGRPVALTARGRDLIKLPGAEAGRHRFVAHCYFLVVLLQITGFLVVGLS